ncbi:uncharacterized protein LOC129778545 [Toxorhynchites rutilus septentrionalis]|uniref:uncharacterized protein LOC129778545 n=1 Tax=Toxorhynchites rutilus septentrionalis TaxID=329112 RepID=UPI00247A23E4|nr:uncharacterized protein LOC129778545 [Toxorhynchites rutilus septentrionalis]
MISMELKNIGLILLVFGTNCLLTSACNGGYEMIIHKIENCGGGKQVITIDPQSTATLTEDCKVLSKSTVKSMGFKSADMAVTISKNGVPVVKEKIDLCASMSDAKSNKDAAEIMTMFGVPDKCPVEAGEIKTDESQAYSLEKYKQHLMMAEGKILVDCKIMHDNGESCFKIDIEVKRKGGLMG